MQITWMVRVTNHFSRCTSAESDGRTESRKLRLRCFQATSFAGLIPEERLPILKTPGVIQIVGYNRSPTPVDETEICAIQTLVATGMPNRPWPFLHAGDNVQIQCGPLRGLQGVLVSFKGNCRLVLSLTLLQRSVAVEIDSAFVAAARPVARPPERHAVAAPADGSRGLGSLWDWEAVEAIL